MNAWKISTLDSPWCCRWWWVVTWCGCRAEPQPHMKAALALLETAHAQLQKATPDKGGHRVKALELVGQAIEEVKKGIAFDNKH